MPSFFLFWIFVTHTAYAYVDFIEYPSSPLIIPSNYETDDDVIGDEIFRAKPENDEDVAIIVSPASDSIVIAPSIVQPGAIFQIFVKDLETIRRKRDYKIQALGLISGNTQEVPLVFEFLDNEVIIDSTSSNKTLNFLKTRYEINIETDLAEEEEFPIEILSDAGSNYKSELVGELSSSFKLRNERERIILKTVPCEKCHLPEEFALVLVASSGRVPVKAIISFTNTRRNKFAFLEDYYETEVEEESSIFRKIIKLRTNSDDEVVYSLDDVSGLFAVHPTTGVLSIQHPEFLNSETVGKIVNLTAVARSGDKKTKTNIQIQVVPKAEAQSFKFPQSSYSFNVQAGEREVGSIAIPTTQIIDYRISEGDSISFLVHNGSIIFAGEFPKDTMMFQLLVIGQSTSSPFSIDVVPVSINIAGIGSNVVQFLGEAERVIKLNAETKPGTTVLKLDVIDKDEDSTMEYGLLHSEIYDINGHVVETEVKPFSIEPDGKSVFLVLKNSIKNMDISRIIVSVVVNDAAHSKEPSSRADIEVIIVRDTPRPKEPVLLRILPAPSAIVLKSETPVGSFVYQTYTSHSNSSVIRYSLPKEPNEFAIDSITGVITTKAPLMPGSKLLLNIVATEANVKTEGLLAIEVASEVSLPFQIKPQSYNISVPLNAQINTTVLTIALDRNITGVRFNTSGTDFFTIDNEGNVLVSQLLPREEMYHNFKIEAKSETSKSTANVTINVVGNNEMSFKFLKEVYNVDIMDDIPLNSFVAAISINQPREVVSYEIDKQHEAEKFFDIDIEGRITVRDDLNKSYIDDPVTIRAYNKKNETSTEMKINFRPSFSCVPEFLNDSNELFFIDENADVETIIGTVKTYDLNAKCNISYHFWDTTLNSLTQATDFATIDSSTGSIRTLRMFDYERKKSYPIVLALHAGGKLVSKLASSIIVNDLNDHPLKFEFSSMTVEVSEAAPIGSVVTTVRAIESDISQKVFYKMKFKNEHFSINEETGAVLLALELDREDEDQFTITVGASNDPHTSTDKITEWCQVTVIVKDVNDNGPLFERGKYEIVLNKLELPGQDLISVHAEDPDLTEETPSSVFYSIKETTFEYKGLARVVDGIFHVNQQTGEVRLEETVNEFVGGVFNILLEAADSLEARTARKDTAVIKVYVHDQSDVVSSRLEKSPFDMKSSDVQELLQAVANITELKVLLRDIKYEQLEGSIMHDSTDVQMIIVNKISSEVVPAEKVLAIMMKKADTATITLRKAYQSDSAVTRSTSSPILYFSVTFILLLCCILAIFGLLICHYRSGYRKKRQLHQDSLVIASTLNRTKHRPFSLTPDQCSPATHYRDDEYSVQERRLSVI